jgi:tetratricopeptide (TPR) repeat protein
MKTRLVGPFLAMLGVLPLAAQTPGPVSSRVAGNLDTKFVEPDCQLPGAGDFRAKSARLYLVTGLTGTGAAENRTRAIREGVRVSSEAITQGGQAKNPGVWYYLGRLYLQQGDLVGADSAFTRAEALAPQCKADILKYRYKPWATLVNEGSKFRQASHDDSAMVMFRGANQILQTQPLSYINMGELFDNLHQIDSSLFYFGKAAATQPTDTNQVKVRNQALYNYGVLLYKAGRNEDAVATFRQYIGIRPDDVDGKKALALALRAAGKKDEAQAIEKELVTASGTPGGAGLSETEVYELAAKQYNDKNYADAAATAGQLLGLNPYSRDALNIQANSYLALQQWDKLGPVADKLVGIEPMSFFFHSMRAQVFKSTNDRAKMAEAIITREALGLDVDMKGGPVKADGAAISGAAKGREARDEAGKTLPAKPITLVFEFLDKDGKVVTSQEVNIPVLAKDATQPIDVEVKAEGIKGWRYRVK